MGFLDFLKPKKNNTAPIEQEKDPNELSNPGKPTADTKNLVSVVAIKGPYLITKEGGYVLMGIGVDENGNYYPTRIIVNQYDQLEAVEPLDVLYAVRAAKKDRSEGHYNPAEFTAEGVS
ncbi:MAG: hypothetical protein IJI14_05785, partial [Anaerolineaceae bacterium]|nr:hypothetical protein [Anaerolineaceae bacterium]